jgi:hypothetical protein
MIYEENTTIELHHRVSERISSMPLISRLNSSPSCALNCFDRQTMMEFFCDRLKKEICYISAKIKTTHCPQ